LLIFLAGLARRHDCGVVLLHHLRKPSGQLAFPLVTIHEFAGSRHITAMARSVLGLSVMQNGKGTGDGGKRFEFGEAPSVEPTTSRDECGEWLVELLAGGPMRLKEIMAAGAEAGYNVSMIWRARKERAGEVVDTKGKQHPANKWALACWLEHDEVPEEASS
jgi:hypothetical protein